MNARITHADLFEQEAVRHLPRFYEMAAVDRSDRVLDIGCGTGQSTREVARAASAGSVLGVDISGPLIEHARRLTAEADLSNVTYLQADAQTHPFQMEVFDLGVSQFGSMFFADPVAAFTNIGRALRPGARLVLLTWQAHDRNEWSIAIRDALAAGRDLPAPAMDGMFSLADPATVRHILESSGFAGVTLTDVHEPISYGPDPGTARDFLLSFMDSQDILAGLDGPMRERALDRLHATLVDHDTGHGVWFDARTWIITATRR